MPSKQDLPALRIVSLPAGTDDEDTPRLIGNSGYRQIGHEQIPERTGECSAWELAKEEYGCSSLPGASSRDRGAYAQTETSWARMRTPSPEPIYSSSRRAPPPPQSLTFTPVPIYVAKQPMLWMMPTLSHDSALRAEDEPVFESSGCNGPSLDSRTQEEEHTPSDSVVDPACAPVTEEDAPSKGSIGHPHYCAQACKYIKKQRGCKDGDKCTRCHLCVFRNKKSKKSQQDDKEAD
jgi:hypothetical protein